MEIEHKIEHLKRNKEEYFHYHFRDRVIGVMTLYAKQGWNIISLQFVSLGSSDEAFITMQFKKKET